MDKVLKHNFFKCLILFSLVQRSPTKSLNKISKPPVWGSHGNYKYCRATYDDDDDNDHVFTLCCRTW
jgi:hypothetical protein